MQCCDKWISIIVTHFICNCTFYFAVTWCTSATSIFLSISSNGHGIKYETCGVIWHVAPESKIQSANYELSLKYLLGLLLLSDKRAIDAYIFWSLFIYPLFHYFCVARLTFSLRHTCFHRFSFALGGFGHLEMRWSSDPHLKHLLDVRSVHLLSESPGVWDFNFYFLILLKLFRMVGISTKGARFKEDIFSLTIFITTWTAITI